MKREMFTRYALQFVGTPYIYASNGPLSFDCSGFVLELLKCAGFNPPMKDMNSQQMYTWISGLQNPSIKKVDCGTILFYGPNNHSISHVAMMLDHQTIIEAGGGDSTTVDLKAARNMGWAMVRIRQFGHRKDFIGGYNPGFIDD